MNSRSARTATLILGATVLAGSALAAPSRFSSECAEADGTAPAASVAWRTVAASGPVDSRRAVAPAAPWIRVARGDELAPFDLLRTGRRGRATLVQGGTVLIVDPESQVELPQPGDGGPGGKVVQKAGTVLYDVDGRTHRGMQVVTPYLVAGVKGTVFMVSVDEKGASVTVDEGVVSVLAGDGKAVEVQAGETALVDAMDAATPDVIRRGNAPGGSDRAGTRSRETQKIARTEERKLERLNNEKREVLDAVTPSEPAVEVDLVADMKRELDVALPTEAADPASDVKRTLEEAVTEEEKQREAEETKNDLRRNVIEPTPVPPVGAQPVP